MSTSGGERQQSQNDSLLDESPGADGADPPSVSDIFIDAALYERIFQETDNDGGEASARGSTDSERTLAESVPKAFNDLVGRDLDSSVRAISDRVARLQVKGDSWTPSETDLSEEDELGQPLVESPASTESEDDEPLPVEELDEKLGGLLSRIGSTAAVNEDGWKMKPEEVVDLLIDEFGPLAADGEEERLILEADSSLVHDVLILGVAHLTTHRLAFHASLLSTRPDLLPSQQILKAGPVTVHKPGFMKKRRVWLELSHDMLTSYRSSRDEDKIKPLRSMIFSEIKSVVPLDYKQPKVVRIEFHSKLKRVKRGFAEFDTVESAADWRKELQAALFLYRHRRRAALSGDTDSDSETGAGAESGVRISVPLAAIVDYTLTKGIAFEEHGSLKLKLAEDAVRDNKCTVHIGTIRPDAKWTRLGEYIERAKRTTRGTDDEDGYGVFVDFGPLNFFDNFDQVVGPQISSKKDIAVRRALALQHEPDLWIIRAGIQRKLTSSGYFALSTNYIGFWSKSLTSLDLCYRLPFSDVHGAVPAGCRIAKYAGLRLQIAGQPDLKLVFKSLAARDEAQRRTNGAVAAQKIARAELSRSTSTPSSATQASFPTPPDSPAKPGFPRKPTRSTTELLAPLSRAASAAGKAHVPQELRPYLPKHINLPQDTLLTPHAMHFVCLTIGSRGDVQPYIALCLGLKKEGHRATIVTHEEYKAWIESFGIEHRTAGGDPGALMKLSVENKMFSPEFFKESLGNFRKWLDELLLDSWKQCQDADVLLESPSAMAGVHIAEKLNIPYFRCFTMPWTKTTEFPHAFLSPPVDSPKFNAASYVLFDNVIWTAQSGQINRWRRKTLNLVNTDMGHMAQSKITFIYNFSSAVVPKPLDWADTTVVSGYWFLDNPDPDWSPPESLVEWMAKAREDEKPIVYIGFGSITVPKPRVVTERIVKAVLQSGVRAIISKGWSSRMSSANAAEAEVEIPPECYQLDKVPHDWLFPQIDAALHHGGAGTTGASLRAGIPTLIKPWFGDQYFWASRVQKLGAGLRVPSLKVNDLAEALTKATSNRVMKEKAASVGERIRSEDGVRNAIHAIYTWLPRARLDRQTLT